MNLAKPALQFPAALKINAKAAARKIGRLFDGPDSSQSRAQARDSLLWSRYPPSWSGWQRSRQSLSKLTPRFCGKRSTLRELVDRFGESWFARLFIATKKKRIAASAAKTSSCSETRRGTVVAVVQKNIKQQLLNSE